MNYFSIIIVFSHLFVFEIKKIPNLREVRVYANFGFFMNLLSE
jgi:hypothetical protein